MTKSGFTSFFICLFFSLFSSVKPQSPAVESSIQSLSASSGFSSFPNAKVIIFSQKRSTIVQLNENAGQVKFFGGIGWGDYEFENPSDVWSSFLLEVYITDRDNRRIQKYDQSLNFIQTIDENSITKLDGRFFPVASATSSMGDLFVVESDGHRIIKINQRGVYEKEFGTYRDGIGALENPVDITITENDEICVLDKSSVKEYDRFGNVMRVIPLPGSNSWTRIQSYREQLIAASPDSVLIYHLGTSDSECIPKSSLLGVDQKEEIQDATLTARHLLVLTPTTLYRCTIP